MTTLIYRLGNSGFEQLSKLPTLLITVILPHPERVSRGQVVSKEE